jgi:hypothetical protein
MTCAKHFIIYFIASDTNQSFILAMPLTPTSASVSCQTDCFLTDGYINDDDTFIFNVTRVSSTSASTQASLPPCRTFSSVATETVVFNIPTFKVEKRLQFGSCTVFLNDTFFFRTSDKLQKSIFRHQKAWTCCH